MSHSVGKAALVLVREAARGRKIREALATQGVIVVGEASDASVALPLIEEREPALLVVELDPPTSGESLARNERVFELVQAARDRLPALKVIAVMESVEPDLIAETAAKGVDAYVLRPDS